MGKTSTPSAVRFRHHPAQAVAGLIIAISLTTLAVISPWFALLTVLPLGWMLWLWRSGTDAGPDGLRVRALLGERRIPWSQVRGLVTDRRGRVAATLHSGNILPLTAVTAADLPRLTAASGDNHAPA